MKPEEKYIVPESLSIGLPTIGAIVPIKDILYPTKILYFKHLTFYIDTE